MIISVIVSEDCSNLSGFERLTMNVGVGTTIDDVISKMLSMFPKLQYHIEEHGFTLNGHAVKGSVILNNGDEIVIGYFPSEDSSVL